MKTSARVSITVPEELKRRMDQCPVQVNWSALAAEAFKKFLDEQEQKQDLWKGRSWGQR